MDKKLVLLVACLFCTVISFSQELSRYDVKIGDFKDLKVADHVNVVYNCNPDSAGYARFDTSKELVDKIMFTNNNKGKLSIQISTDAVGNKDIPTVYVYSEYLQSVDNSTDSTVRVLSVAPGPELKFKNSGSGKIIARNIKATKVEASIVTGNGVIILDGTCSTAGLTNLGAGQIEADKLISTDVNCRLIGTGSIGCYATNVLSIRGTGTGKIYYDGKPKKIDSFQIGTIKAIPLNEK